MLVFNQLSLFLICFHREFIMKYKKIEVDKFYKDNIKYKRVIRRKNYTKYQSFAKKSLINNSIE